MTHDCTVSPCPGCNLTAQPGWHPSYFNAHTCRALEFMRERDAALGEVGRLRGVLRECEWGSDGDWCPWCHNLIGNGHAPNCALAKAIYPE